MEAQERTLAHLTTEAVPSSYTQEIASEVLKHSHLPRKDKDNDDDDDKSDNGERDISLNDDIEMKKQDSGSDGGADHVEGDKKEREDKHEKDGYDEDEEDEWQDEAEEKKKKKKKSKKKKKKDRESHHLSYSHEIEDEIIAHSHHRPNSPSHHHHHHHHNHKKDKPHIKHLDPQMWHIVEELVAERSMFTIWFIYWTWWLIFPFHRYSVRTNQKYP